MYFPVERIYGRVAVVTQRFKPPTDVSPRGHLGIDLMFRCAIGDAPSKHPLYTMIAGARSIAMTDARVLYSELAPNGWRVRLQTGPWHLIYLHHTYNLVSAGELVRAGQPLGVIGADPTDPQGLAHLHFELRRQASSGKRDRFGCVAVDPEATFGWPFDTLSLDT